MRARRRQMRDDYLEWIVDQDEAGAYPTADDFLTTKSTYLERPYTQADLAQTGKWLDEARYIKGPKGTQRSDPLRPAPPAKGRWTIEQ